MASNSLATNDVLLPSAGMAGAGHHEQKEQKMLKAVTQYRRGSKLHDSLPYCTNDVKTAGIQIMNTFYLFAQKTVDLKLLAPVKVPTVSPSPSSSTFLNMASEATSCA